MPGDVGVSCGGLEISLTRAVAIGMSDLRRIGAAAAILVSATAPASSRTTTGLVRPGFASWTGFARFGQRPGLIEALGGVAIDIAVGHGTGGSGKTRLIVETRLVTATHIVAGLLPWLEVSRLLIPRLLRP